jgi:hypothetical protein
MAQLTGRSAVSVNVQECGPKAGPPGDVSVEVSGIRTLNKSMSR